MHIYEDQFYTECWGCDNKDHVIQDAREQLDELVKRLYITDQTNIDKIEQIIDNLCECLRVKPIYAQINIKAGKEKNNE